MENPNHYPRPTESRGDEMYNHEMKKRAFESKNGYSHQNYEAKMKDQMNGMPMPMHMKMMMKKDCS